MAQLFGNPFVVGQFSFIEAVSPKSLTLSFWHLAVFYFDLFIFLNTFFEPGAHLPVY